MKATSPKLVLFSVASVVAIALLALWLGFTAVSVAVLSLGLIIPALQIYFENEIRVDVTIELKKKDVDYSDLSQRDELGLYDLMNWDYLKKQHPNVKTNVEALDAGFDYNSSAQSWKTTHRSRDVICIKVANKGLKEVKFEKVFILFNGGRLQLRPKAACDYPELYMLQRKEFLERHPDTPISIFVDELNQEHGADSLAACSYKDISAEMPCRLGQGDSSSCKVWIDAVFVAFWLNDHNYRNTPKIRAGLATGADDLYESRNEIPFDVAKRVDAAKSI
ncbi:MAG: hypothetical protein WBZ42_10855 [Halobacteriota archaeon]